MNFSADQIVYAPMDTDDLGVCGLVECRGDALCSLIEPAELAGVEPRAYLRRSYPRAVWDPGTVTLPRDLTSSQD